MLNAKQARQMTSCQLDSFTEERITKIIKAYAEHGLTSCRMYNTMYKDLCDYDTTKYDNILITDTLINALIDGGYTVNVYRTDCDEVVFITISW